MPELIIWKNRRIDQLRKDMDRMFTKMWGEFGLSAFPGGIRAFPPIEIEDTPDHVIFKVDMLNIHPEDIDMSITEQNLILKGSIREDKVNKTDGRFEKEHRQGSFSRSVRIPYKIIVDDVTASFKNGVLSITMPKCKEEKRRALKIK